jgi:hypothetical protein
MSDNEALDRKIDAVLEKIKATTNKIINYDIDLKNWKILSLRKDAIWMQRLDEPSATMFVRNGIVQTASSIKGPFAICKVLMVGKDITDINVGDTYLVPSPLCSVDAMRIVDGYKTYYVKEDALMSRIEYEGTEEEQKKSIEDDILLQS